MKTIINIIILIVLFSCTNALAIGNNKKSRKEFNKEASIIIKSHPYSFVKKVTKPNPTT